MKIAVVGIGGVGGLIGGALARVLPQTIFIARGEHLKVIREEGLTVRSGLLGEFTVVPALVTDRAEEAGVVDAVILATKGYDLEEACRQIAPMIGEQTLVVPLLNGVMVSQLMRPLLPPCVLADGCMSCFSYIERPGVIAHPSTLATLTLGMAEGEPHPALIHLTMLLESVGFKASVTKEIRQASWQKYVLMCGVSTAYAWFDQPAGPIREDPEKLDFLRRCHQEIIDTASGHGVALPEDLIDRCMQSFLAQPPEATSSLYRDLRDGKPRTELCPVIARMCELGAEVGVPTPCHQAVVDKYRDRL
ncbi:MAG: 2-dehydropantoate 2-reductase [Clostridia bacterium]|nr:2-dehydropantoate 2-reductase [Clostridia bacterium]